MSEHDPYDDPVHRRFNLAATRLVATLQEKSDPTRETTPAVREDDAAVVASWLSQWLMRRSLCDLPSDAEEIPHDVIVKLMEAAEEDGERGHESLLAIQNPPAYLLTMAKNRAADRRRSKARQDIPLSEELSEIIPSNDDAIAAMLDATSIAVDVRAGMRAADAANDRLVQQVVSTWLDMAGELGKAPSRRKVALRVGVSHTAVNQAIARFRRFLREAADAGVDPS